MTPPLTRLPVCPGNVSRVFRVPSCYPAGALASVFAMGLAVDAPDMMKRISGVLTYGQPRVGDAEYASIFQDNFGAVTL